MSVLQPTDHVATVAWLGRAPDRRISLRSVPETALAFGFEGVPGETHAGLTRPSCVRVKAQYAEGTEIRNARQLSVLSAEEMAATAAALGLERLAPELVGATLVIEGIPDWTLVPPSSRLVAEDGAGPGIVVDLENRPCRFPAEEIEAAHPGHGTDYPKAARGRRGVVAWVERPGRLALGDRMRLHVPAQKPWPHG